MDTQPKLTITEDGSQEWHLNGKLHREDGPAVIFHFGMKQWYKHGISHRDDGPALEHPDGGKEWVVNGLLHRLNGPAIIQGNGDKFWYVHGQLHREDGPAIELSDGTICQWFINGKKLSYDIVNDADMNVKYPDLIKAMIIYAVHGT